MTTSRDPARPAAAPPWNPAELPTLPDLLGRRATMAPESVYFTLYGTPLTAGRLQATCLRYAGALRERGLGPGDKIAMVNPPYRNQPE